MDKKFILSLALIVFLFSSCFPGCIDLNGDDSGMVTKSFNGEYTADDNTILKVININGDIDITSWSGNKVTLDAEKKVEKKYKSELDDVEINVTEANSEIVIIAKYNTEKRNVIVTMTIQVPQNVKVDSVQTTNGNIEVTDVMGDCQVTNTNGNINVNDVNGYVGASLTNGNIDIQDTTGIGDVVNTNGNINVEIYNLLADVDITNTNGNIKVYLLPSLSANVTAKTSNGEVNVHDLALDKSVDDKKHIEGKLGTGDFLIQVTNTNGNINLYKLS